MAGVATMDFFQSQETARKKTGLLVVYYIAAVALIVVAVYLAFAVVFTGASVKAGGEFDPDRLINPKLFLWVTLGTVLFVAAGTLYKISELSQGGKAVATLLGGRPVNRSATDAAERRLLNVVEEMAIASGLPVPPVYVLESEAAINAFAAGFTANDAVIGVTRGCIARLSRDELQGVIAHEFSHILNGDMRLNIKLMGVLHGILLLGIAGYWLMRISFHSSGGRSKRDGRATLALGAFGLLLMVIGFVGVLFGKLIKSAISRQREFLADAAAVQFTRNPDGLSGALKKIGGFATGSKLASPNAEQASHLFFSNGLSSAFLGLMATHPPLVMRIRKIDPQFDGKLPDTGAGGAAAAEELPGVSGLAGAVAAATAAPRPPAPSSGSQSGYAVDLDEFMAQVGAPSADHLEYASRIVKELPAALIQAANEPYGARAVVYALLLNKQPEVRQPQLERLSNHADADVFGETTKIVGAIDGLARHLRLPLLDLAISTLKELSAKQYDAFKQNVNHLVAADAQVDLFEYTLQRMILRQLEPTFKRTKPPVVQYYSLSGVMGECVDLLSCLAHWGADQPAQAARAFDNALRTLGEGACEIKPVDACGLDTIDAALTRIATVSAPVKKRVLNACTACIAADGHVTVVEGELLRAVADALDCPVPPFLPGQRLKSAVARAS